MSSAISTATPAEVAKHPRALSAEERALVDLVPAWCWVRCGGGGWTRTVGEFFRGWLRNALERREGEVIGLEGPVLRVRLGAGEWRAWMDAERSPADDDADFFGIERHAQDGRGVKVRPGTGAPRLVPQLPAVLRLRGAVRRGISPTDARRRALADG